MFGRVRPVHPAVVRKESGPDPVDPMKHSASSIHIQAALIVAAALLISACASRPAAEPPAVIHAGVHSGGSVVAFSQSGELLASGGWEGTVRLWRLPSGSPVSHWRDHSDSVNGIVFLEGDRQLVTAGYDGRLVKRDLYGNVLQQTTAPAPVTHMVADPGKDRMLTGHSDGVVRLWLSLIHI